MDDTIRETHGYQKQGAAYGYTKVKGLNAALATISTPPRTTVDARRAKPVMIVSLARENSPRAERSCKYARGVVVSRSKR